jgi:myo-inositol 2-dehydrogenase/D-chiro-inositol 1-dehydrogenase
MGKASYSAIWKINNFSSSFTNCCSLGMRHARHFANFTPRAELIAVCSPVQAELDAAKAEFGNIRLYKDYEQMLEQEKTLQAVVVASATTVHAEQAIKAIERGFHVLCEKPISTSPEIVSTQPSHFPHSVEFYSREMPN